MGKRKRDTVRAEGRMELSPEVFQKSKKTIRSPTANLIRTSTKEVTEENMEEIKKLIGEFRDEMRVGFRENQEEIRKLKEEMKKKEEIWEREKHQLRYKIQNLEDRLESEEKNKKRNNIVIRGVNCEGENIKERTRGFLEKQLGVKVSIKEAYTVGKRKEKKAVVAKIEYWKEKQEVMKNKNKLRGTQIYIDNDLTMKERDIQSKIYDRANKEKAKGKRVKIGYQKLLIEGVQYVWNNKMEDLRLEETKN